jgi:hypothetical protein
MALDLMVICAVDTLAKRMSDIAEEDGKVGKLFYIAYSNTTVRDVACRLLLSVCADKDETTFNELVMTQIEFDLVSKVSRRFINQKIDHYNPRQMLPVCLCVADICRIFTRQDAERFHDRRMCLDAAIRKVLRSKI